MNLNHGYTQGGWRRNQRRKNFNREWTLMDANKYQMPKSYISVHSRPFEVKKLSWKNKLFHREIVALLNRFFGLVLRIQTLALGYLSVIIRVIRGLKIKASIEIDDPWVKSIFSSSPNRKRLIYYDLKIPFDLALLSSNSAALEQYTPTPKNIIIRLFLPSFCQ